MSRHTLPDGVTPDPAIRSELFDWWWPELAPPPALIGAYYKRGLRWERFEEKFLKYLFSAEEKLCELVVLAQSADVTILCIEEHPAHCHRRLIALACQGIDSSLEVRIG